ncbi:MAG: Asd/ArgC dimerization domain-containing protein [Terriglobales bacterium]
MTPPYRIAVQGATSLLGKELQTALEERHFPALNTTLIATADRSGNKQTFNRGLAAFGGEVAVLEPCTAEALAGQDVIFLCGTAEEARATAALAPARARLVDASGALRGSAGAATAGLEPTFAAPARTALVAHPAAQVLAHALQRLGTAGALAGGEATVFEPVSERGWPGMQELQQQSTRLLDMQSLPEEIFGCQVAFNLRVRLGAEAEPGLGEIRRRIVEEMADLGAAPIPALVVVQAPVFHACLLSLHVRYTTFTGMDSVLAALTSPWLTPGTEYPDVVSVAGADTIPLGPVRADPAGGFWIWAGVDNLRRSAFCAVDAALALLRQGEAQ